MLTLISFLIDFCCFWRFSLCLIVGMGGYPLMDHLIPNKDWTWMITTPLLVIASGIGVYWEIRAARARRG